MSAIHLLELTGGVLHVACHVPVPDGTNDAGLAWPNVLVQSGRSSATASALPLAQLSGDEIAALAEGKIIELVRDAHPDQSMSDDELVAHYREVYAGAEDALADILAALQVWGATCELGDDAKPGRLPVNPQLPGRMAQVRR